MTRRPRTAVQQALALMPPARRPKPPDTGAGYLDLLGAEDPTGAHPGQRLMVSRALPVVYERLWRPAAGRLLMGLTGPGTAGERRMALRMLGIQPGDRVLDVACGPGNFTRAFAAEAGPESIVVGLDASATMLERAVLEGAPPNVAYVRGDAEALPFADATFDAVCCFAALYLIDEPRAAIAELARVLAPGGRVAILTSVHRTLAPRRVTAPLVRAATGVRIFGRDEVTLALREEGLAGVHQRVSGLAQFVAASRPVRRGRGAA